MNVFIYRLEMNIEESTTVPTTKQPKNTNTKRKLASDFHCLLKFSSFILMAVSCNRGKLSQEESYLSVVSNERQFVESTKYKQFTANKVLCHPWTFN